jgi:DNA-binding HxlR family transcriptional regulator
VAARSYGQYCGVTRALELIGERWALLIVRDLLVGPRRYTDLKAGMPRIPTNILSARLKELQDGGVVRRVPLRSCGLVYELTEYGRRLEPVVLELSRWGLEAAREDLGAEDEVTADALTVALWSAFRATAAAELPATDYEVRLGGVAVRASVDAGAMHVSQLAPPPPPTAKHPPTWAPDVVLRLSRGLRQAIAAESVVDERVVEVVSGDPRLAERFAATFRTTAPELTGCRQHAG